MLRVSLALFLLTRGLVANPVDSAADWPAYLGRAGSHFSALASITAQNVKRLRPVWEYRTGGADANNRSQIQCNPLVIDGTLYGSTPDLRLFAVDAATGRQRWTFTPRRGDSGSGPAGVSRGLTYWHDGADQRLLYGAGRYLYAIDPSNGQSIRSFGDNGRIDLLEGLDHPAAELNGRYLAITSPGAIYQDVIIMGMRVGEGPAPSVPGHIRAFDVRTGARRWIFHTIPHPGEYGHETWPANAYRRVGGANCWAGLVVDAERGLVFIPTGSAAFDFYGADRKGTNLFANCLLALDAATGQRRWHFQFVHHDLWDRDLPAAPVLCTVQRNGRKVAAVAQVTKSGHVWVFDRESGESLFPWDEIPVPASALPGEPSWPTQPMPTLPRPFARQRLTEDELTERTPAARASALSRLRAAHAHQPWDPPSEQGTFIFPGFDGGAEWGGPAVDPQGVLYVNSNEMAWLHQMVPVANLAGGPAGAAGLYAQFCMPCHGPQREGNAAANIPRLADVGTRLKKAEVIAMIRNGKGMMPSFNFIPDASKSALADFLLGRAGAPAGVVEHAGIREAAVGGDSPYSTTGYNRFLDPDGYPAIRPPWGRLSAIDLNTGQYRWQRELGEIPALTAAGHAPTGTENYGGPVVTAGGVLFIAATKDEKFRAFAAATGELLWETTLPAGGYATPATYSVNGRQFVVIACGGGKMGTKSGDSYVAFALPQD